MEDNKKMDYGFFECPNCEKSHNYDVKFQGEILALVCKKCEASTCFKRPEGL